MRCKSIGLAANELADLFDAEDAAGPEEAPAFLTNPKDTALSAIVCTSSNPWRGLDFTKLLSLSHRAHK